MEAKRMTREEMEKEIGSIIGRALAVGSIASRDPKSEFVTQNPPDKLVAEVMALIDSQNQQ